MTPVCNMNVVFIHLLVTLGLASSAPAAVSARLPGDVALPPLGDTLQSHERHRIWEAALRYYRARRGATEADLSRQVHAVRGLDPGRGEVDRAPVVLFAVRPRSLAPYDATWLDRVRIAHLVAGICSQPTLDLCPDTTLTTYLRFEDPIPSSWAVVDLTVWEVALDPPECHSRDALVDMLQVNLRLVMSKDGWVVERLRVEGHATGSCSSIRGAP